jgi:hypothetical protein
MRNLQTIAILILLIFMSQFCGAEEIHEDWIKQDSAFIKQVEKSFRLNPLSIGKDLEPWENSRINLGFGYSLIEHSMGKGYVSIFYTFIYKDKKLVSYVLKPQMPNDSRLIQRYLSLYKGLFEIENYRPKNLYFGYMEMSKPLEGFETNLNVSNQLDYFMTPYSGVIYGDYGGIGNEILENREAYNTVKDSINETILIYLLKSINPATRLCAAEFYYSNEETFKQKELIDKLIEKNFKELPEIETMSGCIKYIEDAKKVLTLMLGEYK